MKKYFLLFAFAFQFSAFAENIQGREIPNNGEFFQDENLWKSYYADNLKRLDLALNRKNIVFDSCPSKKLPDNSNDQTNIVNGLSKYMGNFQFLKLNTDVFYSKNDRFQCHMDVTLLKQNFPEHLRSTQEDSIYWSNDLIAQRWKIVSSALKKCGIKIDNLTLTSFEFQGDFKFREPSYDVQTNAIKTITKPFLKNQEIQKSASMIFVYIKNISDGKLKAKRGDNNYWTSATVQVESATQGPQTSIWVSKDTMFLPIAPEGLNPQDPGATTEAHELAHFLTNDETHFNSRQNPDTYHPMSDLWMRNGGTFDVGLCQTMKAVGQRNGILRCSDQYAKLGSSSKNP